MASTPPVSMEASPEAKCKGFSRTILDKARNARLFKRTSSEPAEWPRPPTPFAFANNNGSFGETSIDSELSMLSTSPVVDTGRTSLQTIPPNPETTPPPATPGDVDQQGEATPDCTSEFFGAMPRPQNTSRLIRNWRELELYRLSLRLGERFNFNHDFRFDIDNETQGEIQGFNSMGSSALEDQDTIFMPSGLQHPYTRIAEVDNDDDSDLANGNPCMSPFGNGEAKREMVRATGAVTSLNDSRYPPGIEDILKTPEHLLVRPELGPLFQAAQVNSQGSQSSQHAPSSPIARNCTGIDFDPSIFGRPATEIIRPRYSPRSVTPVHQQPGNWDLRGARAAVGQWLQFCSEFPVQYKEGLMDYFAKWFIPRSSRKYLGAAKKLSSHLELLQGDLNKIELLTTYQANMVEQIEMAVRSCKEDSDAAYNAAVQMGVSRRGLLFGKELAWRRYRIANQPRLDRATQTLKVVKADVKKLRQALKNASSAGPS
ncbi:hypothetical protein PV10_01922 [Exophiala mesophila]|uniref:Uncharacterized protein n=1 Tax=Exophiala mesophila TaxID=212818 RepID=A0A0D1X8D1_EXOME|nr:uncharacterized protein PV10_01922 [Exophiala mesophila]KIV98255.1 hypothetical protein PV10_01922 [Exophiala mesophila]